MKSLNKPLKLNIMRKITFVIGSFVLLANILDAQWVVRPAPTINDLYSVDYYSPTTIWIGTYDGVLVSNNGGATWSTPASLVKDTAGNLIIPDYFLGIRALTPTTVVTSGEFDNSTNTELILRSINGGVTWKEEVSNSSGDLSVLDWSSARMATAGNNGRIAVSNDNGNTWVFPYTGTINGINAIRFAAHDTIFAGGGSIMLKSYNGGVTWMDSTISGTVNGIVCKGNTVYIGIGSSIYKSTNYGRSYSKLLLPFAPYGVMAFVSKDTVIAAGSDGLYVSVSGGTYWERYVLSSYSEPWMINLYNSNTAIAVGVSGFIAQTTNLAGCQTQPVARFSVQGNIASTCINDSITVIDSTPQEPSYTYKWKLGKTVFSTQYNSGIRLTKTGADTIWLVVNNGTTKDSVETIITVYGHFTFNSMNIQNSGDTVCPGNMEVLSLLNSQSGVSYQLRKGYTKIGSAQTGTGGQLNFVFRTGLYQK